jgi:hypothetical protein
MNGIKTTAIKNVNMYVLRNVNYEYVVSLILYIFNSKLIYILKHNFL